MGSFRDESRVTSHVLGLTSSGYGRCELGRSPLPVGKSLRDYYIYLPPRFLTSLVSSSGAGSGAKRVFILWAQVTGSPVLGRRTCRPLPFLDLRIGLLVSRLLAPRARPLWEAARGSRTHGPRVQPTLHAVNVPHPS